MSRGTSETKVLRRSTIEELHRIQERCLSEFEGDDVSADADKSGHASLCIQVFSMIKLVHSALGTSSPIDTPMWESPRPAHLDTF